MEFGAKFHTPEVCKSGLISESFSILQKNLPNQYPNIEKKFKIVILGFSAHFLKENTFQDWATYKNNYEKCVPFQYLDEEN